MSELIHNSQELLAKVLRVLHGELEKKDESEVKSQRVGKYINEQIRRVREKEGDGCICRWMNRWVSR